MKGWKVVAIIVRDLEASCVLFSLLRFAQGMLCWNDV